MLLVPQTAAATWRAFCTLACLLLSLCYSPLVLCPTQFTSSGVFLLFFFFFQLVLFKCLPHRLRGQARQFVLSIFSLFSCLFRFVFVVLVFLLCFRSFLYFIECVCRACRIQYQDMALHFPLLCLLHTRYQVPGTWQRSISVA